MDTKTDMKKYTEEDMEKAFDAGWLLGTNGQRGEYDDAFVMEWESWINSYTMSHVTFKVGDKVKYLGNGNDEKAFEKSYWLPYVNQVVTIRKIIDDEFIFIEELAIPLCRSLANFEAIPKPKTISMKNIMESMHMAYAKEEGHGGMRSQEIFEDYMAKLTNKQPQENG